MTAAASDRFHDGRGGGDPLLRPIKSLFGQDNSLIGLVREMLSSHWKHCVNRHPEPPDSPIRREFAVILPVRREKGAAAMLRRRIAAAAANRRRGHDARHPPSHLGGWPNSAQFVSII
jgi:hypothetical protein